MSHRTHLGALVPLHTEHVFGEPAFWSVYALAALCVAIALLGGCATTSVQCTSLARGACTVSSTRVLTDSAVTLDTPGQDGDAIHLAFTSQPNQAGVSAAFAQLGSVIGLLGKLVAAKAVPDQPTPTPTPTPVPAPLPPFPHASLPMLEAPDL